MPFCKALTTESQKAAGEQDASGGRVPALAQSLEGDANMVAHLIARLDDADTLLRHEAAAALILHAEAVPTLVKTLCTTEQDLKREMLALTLMQSPSEAVLAHILPLLRHENAHYRSLANDILVQHEQALIAGLDTYLQDPDPHFRGQILQALRHSTSPQLIPILDQALCEETDLNVAVDMVELLGRLHAQLDLPPPSASYQAALSRFLDHAYLRFAIYRHIGQKAV